MARTTFVQLPYPLGGVSVHSGFSDQDKGTCADALNARGYDPTTNRLRGAQRCGITKYVATQLNGSNFIQNLEHLTIAQNINVSSGNSIRQLRGVGVAGGTIKTFTRAGYGSPSGGSGALSSSSPFIGSAILLNKIYYADGVNSKYYDGATNTVVSWTATDGLLPVDAYGNLPRLICNWRGRIVMSGLFGDPQNWFMSRQFDALDWEYQPDFIDATMPVAGNNTEAGLVPDVVRTLIPYSDDLLITGGDNSIWQFTGDPAAGGQIDRISDTIGMCFGPSWCKDAWGNVWFVSSRGGLYSMQPGPGGTAAPQRVSALKVDERLMTIDWSANICRMVWDDRFQTIMFFITPTAGGTTINWAYDVRNEAFWPDQFANANHNPTAVHLMDGDDPDDRVALLGGRDGYIRFIDVDAKADDGTAISSYVFLGPIQSNSGKLRMRELRGVLGENSDNVKVEMFRGHSAEAAFDSTTPLWSGNWHASRNYAMRMPAVSQALYLKLSNNVLNKAWQFEGAFADIQGVGKAAGRIV